MAAPSHRLVPPGLGHEHARLLLLPIRGECKQHCLSLGRDGGSGLVVSVLPFVSNEPSLNPAEACCLFL